VAESDCAPTGPALPAQQLRRHAVAQPGRIAYTFLHEDGRAEDLSFGTLDARVELLAGALAARLAPGARAVLLYPPGLEFIVAFFACLRAGVVAVPATLSHRRRGSRRLPALLADADPALVLTESSSHGAVAACLDDAGQLCACLCTDLVDAFAGGALPVEDPQAIAFLQYTSGSTGQPKGVEVSHANIAANVEAIRAAFGFGSQSVMASWLPLFHDMGLVGSVLAPALIGFRSVLMAPASFLKQPARWLQAISHYRATCAGAPDFGWDYCARRVGADARAGLDLSGLALAYNGSEPVRAATLNAFAAAFAGCGFDARAQFPCYGMAEATLFVAGGPRGRAPRVASVSKARLEANQVHDAAPGSADARAIVSCGAPALGTTLLVVDPDSGIELAPHRVGEVWVAGPGVARGYWRRADETAAVFGARPEGAGKGPAAFLRTGDLGFMRDGELFITGRLKDLLIVNGRNIYPQDIEDVIVGAIDFIEPNGCAVFALEEDGRERLAVVAEANRSLVRTAAQGRGGAERLAQLDMLVQQVRAEAARQFGVALGQVVFVRPGTFPRTTSGKVQRARCRRMLEQGELQVVYLSRTLAMPAAPAPGSAARGAEHSRARADAMIAWLRQYAELRIDSRVIDERRTIPPYVVLDLGRQGFFGLQAAREHGGSALTACDLMRVLQQLAAVDLTLATMVGVHNGLGLRPLLQFGPAELQRRLLPPLASGRQLAAYAQTEPQAGSNPLAMRTRAVRARGGWRLSGEKWLVGLASWAGMLTVLAKATEPYGAELGIVALLVPDDAPGLVHGPEALTMGMRGMVQNSVRFDDVFVPDEHVLLAPGEGMEVARDAMGFARLGIGAVCVGAMKRCAQLMARYAARREVGTGRLLDNPVSAERLHELTCAIAALEALVDAIAAALDARTPLPHEACVACKVLASELLWEAADRLVQMLGGRGYLENNLAPQLLRDARVLRILEGPTETLAMHLGASAAASAANVTGFVAATLGQPQVADELAGAIAGVRLLAPRATARCGGEAAATQWLDYRTGELCAWGMLVAAAGAARPKGAAEDWTRRRFANLRRDIESELEGAATRPDALVARIDAYAAAIGDIEQGLAGEGGGLDPLLRREPPAAPQPVAGVEFLRAARADSAPTAQPGATHRMVHEVVMKWLSGEGTVPCGPIGFDTPFTELGMDSLASVPIALELEQQTALPIAPELLYDYQTINALAAYIDAQRPGPPPAAAA
jgi:acyl-CoA synthetase (AMP-forming)/AMP-acid ligase II/alkylation response protein AidB-like acyl-CoA dehydrogenase/acyl carrier protein